MNPVAASPAVAPGCFRRLQIAFVTETYPPDVNGVAMTVGRLVNGLLARGHQVQLIRLRQGDDDVPRQEDGLEIVPQPGLCVPFYRQVKLGLPAGQTLRRLWQHQKPDVVHIFTEGPLGGSALRSARHLRVPVSSSFHTNFHLFSSHYGLGLLAAPIIAYLRRFHNSTACTLVPTAELAGELQQLGFLNTRILARGVDVRLFSPARRSQGLRAAWGAAPETRVALYVGRLAAEKNLDLVFQAYRVLRESCPDTRLVLVGDGPLAVKYQAQYPEALFCGVQRGEDLATHYASADVFLFPSLTETFGNVTLEAMASGLAVIAFDYAAARHYLEHHHNGLRIALGDTRAFIEAARELGRNPERGRWLGRNARAAVEKLDWERVHGSLEQIFLDLIH
jgi:glycosyltransferase involved in cell wall biosynthesis